MAVAQIYPQENTTNPKHYRRNDRTDGCKFEKYRGVSGRFFRYIQGGHCEKEQISN